MEGIRFEDFSDLLGGSILATCRNCEFEGCRFSNLSSVTKSEFVDCHIQTDGDFKTNGANTFHECVYDCPTVSAQDDFVDCHISNGKLAPIVDRTIGNRVYARTTFDHCDLKSVNFLNCNFDEVTFKITYLSNSTFTNCSFRNADLTGAFFGSKTSFEDSDCRAMKIQKVQLATMQDSGITRGQLIDLAVIDHVSILRRQYSGFYQWFHLFAMIWFVMPYAWFITWRWGLSLTYQSGETESLIWQLIRFIGNGGTVKNSYSFSFTGLIVALIVVFNIVFNAARGWLLWKTKDLESEQLIHEMPVRFSLADAVFPNGIAGRNVPLIWQHLFDFCRLGFAVNAFLIVVHTMIFLCHQVPK